MKKGPNIGDFGTWIQGLIWKPWGKVFPAQLILPLPQRADSARDPRLLRCQGHIWFLVQRLWILSGETVILCQGWTYWGLETLFHDYSTTTQCNNLPHVVLQPRERKGNWDCFYAPMVPSRMFLHSKQYEGANQANTPTLIISSPNRDVHKGRHFWLTNFGKPPFLPP